MNNLNSISRFSGSLVKARKSLKLKQDELAKKIGVSRDFIVRMERGDNVGIHYVLSAANILGLILKLDVDAEVVSGGFDEFYQNRFGQSLKEDLNVSPSDIHRAALFKPEDKIKIKVKSWKNSAHI